MPHGKVTIQIVAGEPTKLENAVPTIRFDQPDTVPQVFQGGAGDVDGDSEEDV